MYVIVVFSITRLPLLSPRVPLYARPAAVRIRFAHTIGARALHPLSLSLSLQMSAAVVGGGGNAGSAGCSGCACGCGAIAC